MLARTRMRQVILRKLQSWEDSKQMDSARRFLRSPRILFGEWFVLGLLCTLTAVVPQQGAAAPGDLARLHQSGAAALVHWLALDHLFRSPLFLVAALLALASLLVLAVDQWQCLQAQWRQKLAEADFHAAPFRAEFDRPVLRRGAARQSDKQTRIWTERRWGLGALFGFYAGVCLILFAGALRALIGTEAVVDMFEGQTLLPTPSAWSAQLPGLLAPPFSLQHPLTLNAVELDHYPNGDLRDLKIQLSLADRYGRQDAKLAANQVWRSADGRLSLGSDYGPAMLVEWRSANGGAKREACLLWPRGRGSFEGNVAGPSGAWAFFRARIGTNSFSPERVEIRVLKNGALVLGGDVQMGQSVRLPTGERIGLQNAPLWVRLRGGGSPARWLAWGGFALAIVGGVLVFAGIKLDWCLTVTPQGETERVTLALKPQRFAFLFAKRFETAVREQQDIPLLLARSQHDATTREPANRSFTKAP